MRQFTLIAARADVGDSYETRIASIKSAVKLAKGFAAYSFPAYVPERVVDWISPNGLFAAVGLTNEPSGFEYDISGAALSDSFFGLEGYLISEADTGPLRYSHDLLESTSRLGGCFTVFRANDHGIEAVTDHAGTGNACHATSKRFRIISNRSLWAYLLAESDNENQLNPTLRFDPVAVRNLVNSGSVQGNRTLFAGVSMMNRRSRYYAHPWGSRNRTIETPISDADEEWRPAKSEVERVASSLVEAFSPLKGSTLSLALTGGRDSRMLLAAAQHVSGLDLRTETTGEVEHPDVYIASSLAEALKVPHTRRAPSRAAPETLLSEELGPRIKRVLDGHDWNLSAWDDMPDYGAFSTRPSMSGVGGEGLRGGMVQPSMVTMDASKVATSLKNLQAGSRNLFQDAVNMAALPDAHYWEEKALFNPYEAADRYYKDERSNRWATSRRAAARLRTNAIDPLFDNRFIDLFDTIPATYKWTERLAYDIIECLAPELVDFPIEGSPWKFDAQRALESGQETQTRKAIRSDVSAGVKAWKSLDAPSLRKSMRTFILDRLEGAARNVLDPKAVEELLASPKYSRPALVWNIATAVEVMSRRTAYEKRQPKRETVEIYDAPGLANDMNQQHEPAVTAPTVELELGSPVFIDGKVTVPWKLLERARNLEFYIPQWTAINYSLLSLAIATLIPKEVTHVHYDWDLASDFKKQLQNATGVNWKGTTTNEVSHSVRRRTATSSTSLNFTGGLDSSLARVVAPAVDHLNFLDLRAQEAQRDIEPHMQETNIVSTNGAQLELMHSKWESIGITSILLSEEQEASVTAFGTLAESTPWNFRLGDGVRLSTPPLFKLAGLEVQNPLIGFTEVGLLRSLLTTSFDYSPYLINRILESTSFQSYRRRILLGILAEDLEMPSRIDQFLGKETVTTSPKKWGTNLSHDLLGLYIHNRKPGDIANRFIHGVPEGVLDHIKDFSFAFMHKLNTSIYASYPASYKKAIQENAQAIGIEPYTELDKNEFVGVQGVLAHHFPKHLRTP